MQQMAEKKRSEFEGSVAIPQIMRKELSIIWLIGMQAFQWPLYTLR